MSSSAWSGCRVSRMLIFGVEIDSITIGNVGEIEFTDTTHNEDDD